MVVYSCVVGKDGDTYNNEKMFYKLWLKTSSVSEQNQCTH